MRVLLDTDIVINREASRVINDDIGVLFMWLDRLKYPKYVHPATVQEINKLKDREMRQILNTKLASYSTLNVPSSLHPNVIKVCAPLDNDNNDSNNTLLINEVYNERVDALITEDKKINEKAELLDITDKVFSIDSFLEKVIDENPELSDYKVLSVRKEFFGNIDVNDEFFDSLQEDYPGFRKWFNRKSQETAYICWSGEKILAFLYLKIEDEQEAYPEIIPTFPRKKRLKIGTFKAALNRHLLGERLIKIVFDNAIRYQVGEIYVTVFDKRIEQRWLIRLLEDFGFGLYGKKQNENGDEAVYVRDMRKRFDPDHPKLTYPHISTKSRAFIVSIYPEYHTDLFPDSILRTESPQDFVENEPFRNAISKVYISRSYRRDLQSGDLIVFYRTGGYYKGVVTTIGIVENVVTNIDTPEKFIRLCRSRSVFSDKELLKHWNYDKRNRPFVVNFLYAYSFPKRINLKRLIEIGVIQDTGSVPRGFELLSSYSFKLILDETDTDESIIAD